jgi:hypothetical protein
MTQPEDPEADWRAFTRQLGIVLLFLVIAVIAYSLFGLLGAAIAVVLALISGLWRR